MSADEKTLYCQNCTSEMPTKCDSQRIGTATLKRWKCKTCSRILATLRIENDIQVNIPLSPARPDDGPSPQHRASNF